MFDFIKRLFQGKQTQSSQLVQRNRHNSEEQVEELYQPYLHAENDESYTRWLLAVAEEATQPDEVLCLLLEDDNPDVRFCLAENYNLSEAMVTMLCLDENPYVAHRAQRTLHRLRSSGTLVEDRHFGDRFTKDRKTG